MQHVGRVVCGLMGLAYAGWFINGIKYSSKMEIPARISWQAGDPFTSLHSVQDDKFCSFCHPDPAAAGEGSPLCKNACFLIGRRTFRRASFRMTNFVLAVISIEFSI